MPSAPEQSLVVQLQTVLEAVKHLNVRVARHRSALASVAQAVVSHSTGTQDAEWLCQASLKRHGDSQDWQLLKDTAVVVLQDDTDTLQPRSPETKQSTRVPRLSSADTDKRHRELLSRQHQQHLQRKDDVHSFQVARLELKLRDQEARCQQQTARADALAVQLLEAQQMLVALKAERQARQHH